MLHVVSFLPHRRLAPHARRLAPHTLCPWPRSAQSHQHNVVSTVSPVLRARKQAHLHVICDISCVGRGVARDGVTVCWKAGSGPRETTGYFKVSDSLQSNRLGRLHTCLLYMCLFSVCPLLPQTSPCLCTLWLFPLLLQTVLSLFSFL